MKTHSIEQQITRWSAALVAGALLLVGIGASLFLYQSAQNEMDRALTASAGKFFHALKYNGGDQFDWNEPGEVYEWLPSTGNPFFVEVARPDGTIIYRSPSLGHQALPSRPPGFSSERVRRDGVRLGTFHQRGLTLRLAADLDPINNLLQNLGIVFGVALPLVFLIVSFGCRWIARRALHPVRQIAASAEQITAQHLDCRVPVPATQDEIHRLAVVLNRTFERLGASFKQAVRFSADASHELKTPLTHLRSGIERLLRSPTLAESDQPAVAALLEQTTRLNSITGSLLLLARADAGRLTMETKPVELTQLLESCAEDIRIITEANDLDLALDLPSRASCRGDETRLLQIVCNLFDNAVKYNQPGGRIALSLGAVGTAWRLDIANTGPGISPSHQPVIFERFFRSEHTATVPGSGLGLSLSRELARAHGGELALVRSDESLTVFRLMLPQG